MQAFQSTHPMRGATDVDFVHIRIVQISIHAPHAGCDRQRSGFHVLFERFQSTHPMRGATEVQNLRAQHAEFQSTHPMRGATSLSSTNAGCFSDFNPRTPCGVRQGNSGWSGHSVRNFNPRTPCGVRRCATRFTRTKSNFNPRTPCGVRRHKRIAAAGLKKFQSTHPMRGATARAA